MIQTTAEATRDGKPLPITGDVFRQVMRHWATGVTVVTVCAGSEARGITVNSFTSVSLDPPLVLICIDKRSRTHEMLIEAKRFCVNVLDQDQQSVSRRFAGRHTDEHCDFSECSQVVTLAGAPILDGCLAYLDCSVVDVREAGDHTVFIARVEDARSLGEQSPLVFFRGRYTQIIADAV